MCMSDLCRWDAGHEVLPKVHHWNGGAVVVHGRVDSVAAAVVADILTLNFVIFDYITFGELNMVIILCVANRRQWTSTMTKDKQLSDFLLLLLAMSLREYEL